MLLLTKVNVTSIVIVLDILIKIYIDDNLNLPELGSRAISNNNVGVTYPNRPENLRCVEDRPFGDIVEFSQSLRFRIIRWSRIVIAFSVFPLATQCESKWF